MIAAIRVRYTPTPASAVWGDAVFGNWLNPTVQYSLAHFWFQTSFTLADLKFQIFPPIVIDDPLVKLTPAELKVNKIRRSTLVNAVTARVTESFHPDWSKIDGLLIWFAQPTDLFGGGAFPVPLPLPDQNFIEDFLFGEPTQQYRYLPVAVCDIASPFDMVCQELGHLYDFDHPFDLAGADYGDPYDSMASQRYGGKYTSVNFPRPVDPALPVGVAPDGSDPQRVIGPYVSAAHLTISPYKDVLKAAGMFIQVPASYATGASSFTLHALDDSVWRFPAQPQAIVAVIPPSTPRGDTYYLELRRASKYDSGLRRGAADTTSPPIGVVIHKCDLNLKKEDQRIVYVDTFSLADNRGDRDYHMFGGGDFTFRVTSIGADYRSVGITIGGRDFWRHFGINIEQIDHDVPATTQTDWMRAAVSPCFMFPVDEYYYHYEYSLNIYTLIVSSFGYEKPGYVWSLNGVALDPTQTRVNITTSVELPAPTGTTVTNRSVQIDYGISADRLSLSSNPELGNFSLTVEVKSVETSSEVLKNFYEDRSIVTSVRFANMALVWDQDYRQKVKACDDAIDAVNKKRTPRYKVGVPDLGDPFRGRSRSYIFTLTAVTLGVISAAAVLVANIAKNIAGQGSRRR